MSSVRKTQSSGAPPIFLISTAFMNTFCASPCTMRFIFIRRTYKNYGWAVSCRAGCSRFSCKFSCCCTVARVPFLVFGIFLVPFQIFWMFLFQLHSQTGNCLSKYFLEGFCHKFFDFTWILVLFSSSNHWSLYNSYCVLLQFDAVFRIFWPSNSKW